MIIEDIIAVAKAAGKTILAADRSAIGVQDKQGHANFVTKYDVRVQEEVKEALHNLFPEAKFLCEEDDKANTTGAEYLFIIDPIDGTTNFIKDYHMSCISIGLVKNNERFMGVVYNPYLDEVFYAERGKGAFLNGKQIHVSGEPLSNGIVLFGTAPYYEELNRKSFDMAYDYFKKALDIRRSGSAALDLCAVAAGRAELFFELNLSPWDFAAGALIVEEAGGVVTDAEGGALPITEPSSLIARNGVTE